MSETVHDPAGPQGDPSAPVPQPGGPPEPVTPIIPDAAPDVVTPDPPDPQAV